MVYRVNYKVIILSLLTIILAVLLIYQLTPPKIQISYPTDVYTESVIETHIDEECSTESAASEEVFIQGFINQGAGLAASLRSLDDIDNNHVVEIINALQNMINFRLLQPNDEFLVRLCDENKTIMEFIYKSSPVLHHVLKRESMDSPLVYEEIILPTEKRRSIVEGMLDTTLVQALSDLNVAPDLRATAANVLASTVSFRTHARRGDIFKLFIEEEFYEDIRVGGTILYAFYKGQRAGSHEAFFFRGDDTRSAYNNHYSRDGKALASSAFRLPLDRIYVTSPFGYRRHPITNRRTFHNGVDYRGRVGTPVYAIAEGTVRVSGYDRNAGNMVVITHRNGYESHYYHLHRRLVRVGQTVRGRQQIGTVGSTGRSTGPHLHLGLKHNNKWINPANMRMIATAKLEGDKLAQFKKQIVYIENMVKEHETIHHPINHLVSLLNKYNQRLFPPSYFLPALYLRPAF